MSTSSLMILAHRFLRYYVEKQKYKPADVRAHKLRWLP